ncbi:hypothetical protein SAMN02746041_02248 [Desulfacinum hydrothermale DSM 13146]|uniref:ParB-like catalytic effector domain-containing protein n=1 Tax=Desulfacinum hydrothermale DSM 13146 TaxID=1121390 RepID=A0A1W1XMN3_9BACT|nr:hypothetical protein [Desulfacinum hydrothermale]SMC25213.1 hypothetical protein SAMN02746041_02248 [Desulfacinum hydrothermale DSM 13146]
MDVRVVKVEHFGAPELLERLRRVTLLKRPEVLVYKDAAISLEEMATEDLYPAQRYVLVQELQKVRHLKWELEGFGYDLFRLNGYVKVWLEGAEDPIDVLPPIVEESVERNGRVVHIINDGMHRLYLAYLEWTTPQVVFVRGLPKDLPYYAFPNPRQWDGIELVEELPPGYIKKWHRIRDYHSLYRNFNSAFDNVGAPRGNFTNKKAS